MLITKAKCFMAVLVVAALAAFAVQNVYAEEGSGEYDDNIGPVIMEFITTVNLNLRGDPSTDNERLALLPAGTIVVVHEFVPDGFSGVTVNGMSGYVSSEFIRQLERPQAMSEAAFAPALAEINGNVELLHWSHIREIMPTGTIIQVFDIRSGLTYFVRNWSNGRHADVDTLTYEDTQIMRRTFGGVWSWDPRPVLVTFNGRTFAAAINGMPHGGSMVAGNGINGHFCLHFYGSATHNGNRAYERWMQETVMEAFNSAR